MQTNKRFRIGGKLYSCDSPLVMGVVNVTPDSFFEGSRAQTQLEIATQVQKHIDEGVDILDFGAYSSRPGAENIDEQTEFDRLLQAVPIIKDLQDTIPISVDTFRSGVVRRVFDHVGDFMVNDISAGHIDSAMYATVAQLRLTYIGMHMRGTPQTMQSDTEYHSLVDELVKYFAQLIEDLKILGVPDIIVDPGFGFSKTLSQNYELLAQLKRLEILDRPILVGLSRKSMLYKLLDIDPAEALNGTSCLNTIALVNGADILRVHDVKEAKQAVQIVQQLAVRH